MSNKLMNNDSSDAVSLNKYISGTGFCSRREADSYIEQGRVTVNDKTAQSGTRVHAGDVVEVDGEPLKKSKKQVTLYMAFNKPEGITSTTDTKDRTNIISYINYPKRIFPVGRLDKDSNGLILLTNDGDIVNKILRAGNYHEKEYIVMVDKDITPDFIQQMSNGVPVLGKVTRKCVVKQESKKRFRIVLTQGMNRQIRRMCQFLGYKVVSLTRVRIMNIRIGTLPVGAWRLLTTQEVDEMNRMIASSSKTEEASAPSPKAKPYSRKPEPKGTEDRKHKSAVKAGKPEPKRSDERKHKSAGKAGKPEPKRSDERKHKGVDKASKTAGKKPYGKAASPVKTKDRKTTAPTKKATPEQKTPSKKSYKEWRGRK